MGDSTVKQIYLLNVVLMLTGGAIIALGLNIGLGGIHTLGWQLPRNYLTITDPSVFQMQDNHIRFVGGVWFGVGALFVLGSIAREKLRLTLVLLCFVIALAGVFRFSAMDMSVLGNADIIRSLMFELIGFPLLALWIWRS
jgi:uncharacterized protein DUF4345